MNALWLALDFPHFTLDRVTRGHARAGRLVLAVSDAHPQRPRIMDCTVAAQRLGVRAGLPLNGALALADTLQVVSPDPGEETAALERLAAWCYQYSSQVALDLASDPPGGATGAPPALLLEVAGSERLFGPAESLAVRLVDALGGLGYRARAGLAPTP
ncbi:MAG: hypothetical protein R3233_02650, partial [Xanthomonadales bacterium]|nr:hypothetical protein [Xanthomonadales bacterium]